ncbi:metal ABC transporter ATP-binding protein [Bogoriella caseilytica]|uniref:Zinc transport system ATP-binding protein n=1 Tax=Bogoriella caseilytica TaxID=56055 RepID=A0A3N2BFV9_9MICO|nr:ATP-binding cassette domain-containing protein [Bogoriella caseilytica]ROR74105.1 zinc transport system ATP-binding protein [Bogoriella caseilytica]
MSTPAIRTSGLTVLLGGHRVLNDVSLEIASGESVALFGANGSGKSTLVRALLGLVPITAGRAEVLGTVLGSRTQRVPWQRVGYVPQRITASAGVPATAEEVVASGLLSFRRLRIGRSGREQARAALAEVGLADRAKESVQIFSGGQQQRVLIARALVREPELLVLDEPLAGIDHDSADSLAGTITMLRQRGTTVLTVLHEPGVLGPLVERAIMLREGRVIHEGPVPAPEPGHEDPAHDHVHPHVSSEPATHGRNLGLDAPLPQGERHREDAAHRGEQGAS